MNTPPGLKKLIISAPFGNYVQPADCTATLGTFTAEARPGRVRRILATVRRYRRIGAWVNKIGLRNPGIAWLAERVESGRVDVADKIVSIHGFEGGEWYTLLERVGGIGPMAVELNMSCPNVGHVAWPLDLFSRAAGCGVPVIVKLPPVNYRLIFEQAVEAGLRMFHCCNTLPIPAGGISGKPLKPVALQCIGDLKDNLGKTVWNELCVIGGGGITTPRDIADYAAAGAKHFAVGTKVFSPLYLVTHKPLRPLIEAAESA